jgi:succinate dehydrogenase hydrophobic anchor subunit
MQKQNLNVTIAADKSGVHMEGGGVLFYAVGVTALACFFSPFVMIYFVVKATNKVVTAVHSKVHKEEVGDELNRKVEDISGFLRT